MKKKKSNTRDIYQQNRRQTHLKLLTVPKFVRNTVLSNMTLVPPCILRVAPYCVKWVKIERKRSMTIWIQIIIWYSSIQHQKQNSTYVCFLTIPNKLCVFKYSSAIIYWSKIRNLDVILIIFNKTILKKQNIN